MARAVSGDLVLAASDQPATTSTASAQPHSLLWGCALGVRLQVAHLNGGCARLCTTVHAAVGPQGAAPNSPFLDGYWRRCWSDESRIR